MYSQLDKILTQTALQFPQKVALNDNKQQLDYQTLEQQVSIFADRLIQLGLAAGSRIAIYLPKQIEAVVSKLAASRAGLVFVPVNPLLKPHQVSYILQDCNVELLVTSGPRSKQLAEIYSNAKELKHLVLVDDKFDTDLVKHLSISFWNSLLNDDSKTLARRQRIDQDLAAILYTSGSTGNPKGVCLSHRNLIAGAQSVSSYLKNTSDDIILAVLPLSFDYGLSQITTSLLVGATVILMEYLLPRDVIRQVEKHHVTGLAAVPPLWFQLAQLEWPESCQQSLRYITNSGGAMPKATLTALQKELPGTSPYLMYGLTEAFRSTYLDPNEIEKRPDSIGKAIPNAEILVLREDGSVCDDEEPGELVHRGSHVSLGYWNAPEKTAKRFRPIGKSSNYLTELAVWSGDQVRRDKDGFLYFIGRADDMIKCSGYRISPSELEDTLFLMDGIKEVAALGIADDQLGQAVMLVINADAQIEEASIKKYCMKNLPNFMQPKYIELVKKLPRNPNGKIDRKQLKQQFKHLEQ
ncbi:acyl-CoA ligase (AMP-forming), exosortase A system-associated [Kangiella sp. HZ709]|uniref:acyl-CoA ligase (AMP-forming), exosortase A system-associated n=1 Tax=Kangiella sp. HZ709 TaxID=2666328 RepID=UPI0012B15C1D|nr:acyl-CoA ligase (AMP-forming), exosortase A system-associated [Kangiella sp. HZ709]MRX28011.1 acyl-CoA ligase (AMP-forming), exosortase A system-associated [Kangiella sp. HZ709]